MQMDVDPQVPTGTDFGESVTNEPFIHDVSCCACQGRLPPAAGVDTSRLDAGEFSVDPGRVSRRFRIITPPTSVRRNVDDVFRLARCAEGVKGNKFNSSTAPRQLVCSGMHTSPLA